MQKINTFLFDLDGTLTDPGEGITNSVAYALSKYGISVPDRRELYAFIGPPLTDSFIRYYSFSEEEAERAVEIYREYFRDRGIYENTLYPGIKEMLSELNQIGKKLVLATSKPQIFAKQILDHFALTDYFSYVAGSTLDHSRTDKHDVIDSALVNTISSVHKSLPCLLSGFFTATEARKS